MPHIQLNDISMYYEIYGQGEPLVFISGFGADHADWSAAKYRFEQNQVILFDNRGVGQTDVPESPYSLEQMVDDVAGLCAALGIKRAHFIGNSMGGCILQMLTVRYSHLVKSAIISNSAMVVDSPFQIYLEALYELFQAQAPQTSILKSLCSWMFSYQFLSQPEMLPILIQMGLEKLYPFTAQGFEGQRAALKQFNSTSWVHNIKVPTLVLAADEDIVFSAAKVQQLAEQISDARYYCFAECGHLPHIEYPEKFAQVVSEFIASIKN